MPEKDPFLLLRSNLKRHTAEKPTRVVDPPSALRFSAALAVCAASPLTTTHGQGPVQLGKGTGCALVWPRPSAGSSRIACSNGHMSRPQRPTAHAPAAAAAAALGHIYLSAHSSAKRTRQSSKRKWESATERSIRESGGDVGFELLKLINYYYTLARRRKRKHSTALRAG